MGHGSYSMDARSIRSESLGYEFKSAQELFSSKMNSAMNPSGLTVRECRDNDDHPKTVAIVLALDVTGSMGSIPHFLVKEGLPTIMDTIIKRGEKDPAMLFLGIGDHTCDQAPLQVGQFEASDELLDKWLTDLWLEGNGGGNDGESYLLAWYTAAKHTSIDCFEKRGKKGYLFTIGDEKNLQELPKSSLKALITDGQFSTMTAAELLEAAREKYEVYHLHLKQGHNGNREDVMDSWKQVTGDHLIIIDRKEDVPAVIAGIVAGKTVAPCIDEGDVDQQGPDEEKKEAPIEDML